MGSLKYTTTEFDNPIDGFNSRSCIEKKKNDKQG